MSAIDFIQKELLSKTSSKKVRKQILEVCFKAKEKFNESDSNKSNNDFETKMRMVTNHLEVYGNITSWEAIKKYKATRLSAIIFRLRRRGYDIVSIREKNDKSNWVRYYFNKSI